MISIIAPSSGSVLIQGETGVGKDVAARAIAKLSGRKGKFISVNCAAIPSELLESELFGHEKGAFTGADSLRKGRFELADGGTLFLDEIGDMSLSLQAKLLRALETRTIQRVGSSTDIPVDFRLICATHQNLEHHIAEKKFRADLYFRINIFPIIIPSLAARIVDIPLLLAHFSQQLENPNKVKAPQFTQSAYDELAHYSWPGNIRELRTILERTFLLFAGCHVTDTHIRENLLNLHIPHHKTPYCDDSHEKKVVDINQIRCEVTLPHPAHYRDWFNYFSNIDLRKHFRDIEIILIEAALRQTKGHITDAAKSLTLQRTTLIEKMKKLGITRPPAQHH